MSFMQWQQNLLSRKAKLGMQHPPQITELIERLAKLPGLGRKSATRLALYFLNRSLEEVRALSEAILAVKEKIRFCSLCHDYTETDPCPRCSDPARDRGHICVVESPADLMTIESSGLFKGLYHVLCGVINPLAGIGPDEIRIAELFSRLDQAEEEGNPVREILLATGSSPEAETTCAYLSDRLKDRNLTVTRLARGLPLGVDLEYVDGRTLKEAFIFRREAG
jgi:recombination protein RecR